MNAKAILLLLVFCAAILQPVTGTIASTCTSKVCTAKSCTHKKAKKDDCQPCCSLNGNSCCTIYLPASGVSEPTILTTPENKCYHNNDNRIVRNLSECFHPPEAAGC